MGNFVYKIGLDVGSTTAKVTALEPITDKVVFKKYIRHNTKITETVSGIFKELGNKIGNKLFSLSVTGSAGFGISEKMSLPFIQEVVATTVVVKKKYPEVKTLIDIGGEDSKMIFFSEGRAPTSE